MSLPLVIFGTTELAELAYYYFKQVAGREVVAFTADAEYIDRSHIYDVPVIPFEELATRFPPGQAELFVAIGSSNMNSVRIDKFTLCTKMGYSLTSFISPNACVHTQLVGTNCLILDMNNVHPYVSIGHNVFMSNGNHIGHHSAVEDHCFITSNVVIGGGARIGEGSFLGINSTIRDHVNVGKYNLIGAGAMILKDTENESVFSVAHTPVRKISSREIKDL